MSRGRGQGSEEISLRSNLLAGADPAGDILTFRSAWKQASGRERANFVFPNNLDYADFSHLDLRDVDLRDRSLYGADLTGTDLRGSALSQADLRSVKWDFSTNFPLTEIDYKLDPSASEQIEKLMLLTPNERRFTEKNPNFMVMVENGVKSLFWLDENGNIENPEPPAPDMAPLPGLQRSIMLPTGDEMVITKEFYNDGKLNTLLGNSRIYPARFSTEADGTIVIENYLHGQPSCPYTTQATSWEGSEHVDYDLLDKLLFFAPHESHLHVMAPQKVVIKPGRSEEYLFYPNEENSLVTVQIDTNDSACLNYTKNNRSKLIVNLKGDEAVCKSVKINDDKEIIQITDRCQIKTISGNLFEDKHQLVHREQITISNKEKIKKLSFSDGTEASPAKTITTYVNPVMVEGEVIKCERSRVETYNSRGELHSLQGPAVKDLDKNGRVTSRVYYVNGRKMRDAQQFVMATQMYRK